MNRLIAASAALVILSLRTAAAELPTDTVTAPIVLLVEAETGTVLFERAADRPVPPASLTKLMTLHLSLSDVESGILESDENHLITPDAAAESMRYGSSNMGLLTGDRPTLITLQRAAAVISAGDAAWALAAISSGGRVDEFVKRMNREARSIGMMNTVFVDPDGWSARSETTARDMMLLALEYLGAHPRSLKQVHALTHMVYADRDHLVRRPVLPNTNLLVGRVDGVDGLKTGAIPGVGYHLLATAEREDVRFVALVMGILGRTAEESLRIRAADARTLIEWAFGNYTVVRPELPEPIQIRVLHGSTRTVEAAAAGVPSPVVMASAETGDVTVLIEVVDRVEAPVEEGDLLGTVTWFCGGRLLGRSDLISRTAVSRRWRVFDLLNAGGSVSGSHR